MCVESQLPFERYRLWSLADMIPFLAPFVCQIYSDITRTSVSLRADGWKEAELHEEAKVKYAQLMCLGAIAQHRDVLDDENLQMRVWALQKQLEARERFTGEMLARELDGILSQVMACVGRHKYAFIPAPNDHFFEQEQLFGGPVYEFFPQARQDIKDAGNCIAASLYTAAVFHLMRVSEMGLHTLAKRLKVKLTHKGKPQPIDTATWDKVINAARSKLQGAHQLSLSNPRRADKVRLYADLLDHCVSLKDLYRNDVAHGRVIYGHHDALAIFERVKGFMQVMCGV